MKGESVRICELCNREANLYCDSDAAYLCSACDSAVHNANFLVARHIRRVICPTCSSLTGAVFSGDRSAPLHRISCRSCSPDTIFCSSSSTLSSACISTTETTSRFDHKKDAAKPSSSSSTTEGSSRRRNIPAGRGKGLGLRVAAPSRGETRAEGIFVNWCKRLGLNGNLVVSRGVHAMRMCLGGSLGKPLPFRVSLAASIWLGIRLSGDESLATWPNLRSLEALSGVPAKVIAAVVIKLENVLTEKGSEQDLEEGWAEC